MLPTPALSAPRRRAAAPRAALTPLPLPALAPPSPTAGKEPLSAVQFPSIADAPHLALGICTAGRKVGTLLLQLPPKLVQLGGVGFDLSAVGCLLCLFFLLSTYMR